MIFYKDEDGQSQAAIQYKGIIWMIDPNGQWRYDDNYHKVIPLDELSETDRIGLLPVKAVGIYDT